MTSTNLSSDSITRSRMPASWCWRRGLLTGLLLLASLLSRPGLATTLLGMDIEQLTEDAELVFEGEVLSSEPRRDSTGMIYTWISFAVRDVIKGKPGIDLLELRFAGGSIDGEGVEVSGLTMPRPGEQGIYFVESSTRALVNPLLGWSQGHFIIREEAGDRSVYTVDDRPVLEVRVNAGNASGRRRVPLQVEDSNPIASGIVTASGTGNDSEAPMSADAFKSRISELLEP